jgi:transcriptional regulator with XRE-family HTH domain
MKNLRLENGWSQEQLSNLTTLSIRTIQRIEKEDKGSLESLNLLALAFKLDIKELQAKLISKDSQIRKEKIILNKSYKKKIIIFFLVNLIIFIINMITNPYYLWFIYIFLGWGILIIYKIIKPTKQNNENN